MSSSWHVLQSKPHREDFLFSQLQHRQIEVFYPRLRVNPINPRSRKLIPFFPGYLFVHIDLNAIPLSSLFYIPGVNRVVSFDSIPAIVSEEVITGIKHNLERINTKPKQQEQLAQGDPVLILGGPFEGYQAIFDARIEGSERVRLLIKFLRNQQVRIQVPANMVKPKKK
ncbi:MAG: transcription termination/antitermination NusG family protein [Anaerolineaceae bacterium]